MSDHAPLDLVLILDRDGISDRRLDDMTIQLKSELEQIRPASVDRVRVDENPNGTMAGEAFTLGAIALAVLPVTIPALIQFLHDWKLRNANRTITIRRKIGDEEIEVTVPEDISPARLKSFIKKVTGDITSSTND